eukprot:scaffold5491_cov117-Isochrysis_galbana.AAC.9
MYSTVRGAASGRNRKVIVPTEVEIASRAPPCEPITPGGSNHRHTLAIHGLAYSRTLVVARRLQAARRAQ